MAKADAFFDQGILLVAAENPRGATVFKDLSPPDPPTTEIEFTALWKLYALAIVAQQLREYDIRGLQRDNQDGNPATIRMRMRRCWDDEGRA